MSWTQHIHPAHLLNMYAAYTLGCLSLCPSLRAIYSRREVTIPTPAQANHPPWDWGVRGRRAESTHTWANLNPHLTFTPLAFLLPIMLHPTTARPHSNPTSPRWSAAFLPFSADDWLCRCPGEPRRHQEFRWLCPIMHHTELLCCCASTVSHIYILIDVTFCDERLVSLLLFSWLILLHKQEDDTHAKVI